jgi:hypothetical protein
MPTFPTKEAEVVALAEAMIAGYTAHAAEFPSVTVLDLQTALSGYQTDKSGQDDARAQAKIATETKEATLEDLVELMKNDLKLSEVDVTDDPEKLALIGWGPRQQPQPVPPPGQPENFVPTVEGPGDVWLKWDNPSNGGTVRNYIIERRDEPAGGGDFGPWEVVETSLSKEVHLLEQPRGIQMEYRVIAANVSGESLPSNTAAVVL